MLSVLIQNDELFEISGDLLVPILYTFRTGNFTTDGVIIYILTILGESSLRRLKECFEF